MSETRLDYEEIRLRAEKRVQAQVKFLKHLGVYICVNFLVWADWFTKPKGEFPLALSIFWGFILLVHGISVFFRSGLMDRLHDQAYERELELEKQRLRIEDDEGSSFEEKPKRKNSPLRVRLTDDGELAGVEDEDPALTMDDLEKRG